MLATENYGATRIGYSGNAESQRQYIFGWELQPEELFPDVQALVPCSLDPADLNTILHAQRITIGMAKSIVSINVVSVDHAQV
jgi:hypothetical protein